jgi:hypothetical protein
MFPLEEGFGEQVFPIVVKRVSASISVNLRERFHFWGIEPNVFSFQTPIRASGSAEHKLTYASGEVERGAV